MTIIHRLSKPRSSALLRTSPLALALAGLLAPVAMAQAPLYGILHGLPSAGTPYVTVLGDVDGDGDLDAVTGSTGQIQGLPPDQDRLFLNDGTGVFTEVPGAFPPYSPGEFLAHVPVLADLNGDGKLDVMFGCEGRVFAGAQNRLFFGDGAGGFTDVTATNLPQVPDPTVAIALGDIDGDGDLDALIGNSSIEVGYSYAIPNALLRNDGGVFTDITATNLPTAWDFTRAVAFADVDNDGDPDAIVAHNYAGAIQILRNDAGVFTEATASHLPYQVLATSVVFGDFDGVGGLDMLAGEPFGPTRLFFNSGGLFTEATPGHLPPVVDHLWSLATDDVDGDGDLDLLLGGSSSAYGGRRRVQLLLNDGAGVFADETVANLPAGQVGANSIVTGDVDMDGDVDVWINQPNQLLINLRRQVAWRDAPRIGQPLTIDVYGAPAGLMQLFVSAGSGSLQFPPFGTFQLDLATTVPVISGTLSGQGLQSLTLQVPPNPSFVGVSLYWQAVVTNPVALTNLEVTTFAQ